MVPQCRMQHRAALGRIDDLARKHRIALLGHIGSLGQRQQQLHGLGRHRTFGEIQQQVILRCRKFSEPVTPARKSLAHVKRCQRLLMFAQIFESF